MGSRRLRIPRLFQGELFRFESHLGKRESGCIEWVGLFRDNGQGLFRIRGRKFLAHRVAYFISTGKDPKEKVVIQSCKNPKCCNPEHLSAEDERMRKSKMTPRRIVLMRRMFATGHTLSELGTRFGLTVSGVSAIVNGKSWTNIPLISVKDKKSHWRRGSANHKAKLNAHTVLLIRAARLNGRLVTEIAKSFNVSKSAVSQICRREIWQHVT